MIPVGCIRSVLPAIVHPKAAVLVPEPKADQGRLERYFGELKDEVAEDREEGCCPCAKERSNWSRFQPVLGRFGEDASCGQRCVKSKSPSITVL